MPIPIGFLFAISDSEKELILRLADAVYLHISQKISSNLMQLGLAQQSAFAIAIAIGIGIAIESFAMY